MIDLALRAAYVANIIILVPVLITLYTGPAARIFGATTPEVGSLKLLVVALWAAILLCSVIGLAWPRAMIAILVLQIIYKLLWLVLYVWPTWRAGQTVAWGPAITFVPIVMIWPFIVARALFQ